MKPIWVFLISQYLMTKGNVRLYFPYMPDKKHSQYEPRPPPYVINLNPPPPLELSNLIIILHIH